MRRAALYLVLALAAVSFIYPFLWMAATTFKPASEVGTLGLVPCRTGAVTGRWTICSVGEAAKRVVFRLRCSTVTRTSENIENMLEPFRYDVRN